MTKRILLLVTIVLMVAQGGQAVLRERNFKNTLEVLLTELNRTHEEQVGRISRFNEMSKMFERSMSDVMDRSQQIEHMLYSHRSE